jgi:hypothetical protein
MGKIKTLEELDKKMAEQKERLKEKKEETKVQQPPPEQFHAPYTTEMHEAFKENVVKSIKCWACGWQNFGQLLVLMNTIEAMRERIPLPTLICGQCGTLFVPKWARKVVNKAIAMENKIVKQSGGRPDGE